MLAVPPEGAPIGDEAAALDVVGDPAHHGPPSGPVEDWMREANRGRALWFVADDAELARRLAEG